MIAGPGVLHEGYNSGENLADAVNFAFPQWLRIISNVIPCTCFKYNLAIDVKQLYLTWQDVASEEQDGEKIHSRHFWAEEGGKIWDGLLVMMLMLMMME